MVITREELIRMLSEKSGYWMKDIRAVLQCMDEVVFDALCEATLEEEIQVQIVTGIKCGCKIIGERPRVNPQNQEPIIVGETTKPFAKFSQDYRNKLQEAYDNKKNG
jgi:nucleoid DNA-binding protein